MSILIKKYPDYSVFTSAYKIIRQNNTTVKCHLLPEGVIKDFFEIRRRHHIMRTSAVIVHKKVFTIIKGFPEGMIGGEDDYNWAKIAHNFEIFFTLQVLVSSDNRNSTFNQRRGQQDNCKESWLDLYQPGRFNRNEFIASKAIIAGIRHAYSPSKQKSKEIERQTSFTVLSRRRWQYLYPLNSTPYFLIILLKLVTVN